MASNKASLMSLKIWFYRTESLPLNLILNIPDTAYKLQDIMNIYSRTLRLLS